MIGLKTLLLIGLAAYACASPSDWEELKKQMRANAAQCKEEFNVEGHLKDIFKSDQEQPDNVKCFLDCVFKKNGLLKDGKIEREAFVHAISVHLSPEVAEQVADACLADADLSSCDGVGKFHICTVKKVKDIAPDHIGAD